MDEWLDKDYLLHCLQKWYDTDRDGTGTEKVAEKRFQRADFGHPCHESSGGGSR